MGLLLFGFWVCDKFASRNGRLQAIRVLVGVAICPCCFGSLLSWCYCLAFGVITIPLNLPSFFLSLLLFASRILLPAFILIFPLIAWFLSFTCMHNKISQPIRKMITEHGFSLVCSIQLWFSCFSCKPPLALFLVYYFIFSNIVQGNWRLSWLYG